MFSASVFQAFEDISFEEMAQDSPQLHGSRTAVIAAFAAIYLIWGSTYLAIRVGLESLPPFLLAGSRFVIAGVLLYGWLRIRGLPRPTDRQWWAAVVTGVLMLVFGVGGVTWAEQWVPSGVAALLVTTVPLWMALLDAVVYRQGRISGRDAIGMVVGIAGVSVLVGLSSSDLGRVHPAGAAIILLGAMAWSVGSLHSRRADLPKSPAMTVAIQMISAGVVLLAVSSVLREWQDGFSLGEVTMRSASALVFLAIIGSIVTLSAYVWLLRTVSASAVATYAFVNPVVAIVLGWAVAGEAMSPRVLAAAALIIGSVVLIQSDQWRQAPVADARVRPIMEARAISGNLPVAGPAGAAPPAMTTVCATEPGCSVAPCLRQDSTLAS